MGSFRRNLLSLVIAILVFQILFILAEARRGRGRGRGRGVLKEEVENMKLGIHDDEEEEQEEVSDIRKRKSKFLSMFQLVSFSNTACAGTGNKNGTCYTSAECTARTGISGGSCAGGYGVCCLISIGCGGRSNENNTYFENSGTTTAGECKVRICPSDTNICQIRLDFDSFVIAGPSTSTVTTTGLIGGAMVDSGGVPATVGSQCLTDRFQVTNTGGTNPDIICGTNTGEHMIFKADRSGCCATVSFILGQTGVGTPVPSMRSWSIKVTQYSCSYNNLAPEGCTQYFYGPDQMVKTFNYQGGQHLANQNQVICVRRERNMCRLCWYTLAPEDFMTSGPVGMGSNQGSMCGNYGTDGMGTLYDFAQIPGGRKVKNLATNSNNHLTAFCGSAAGLVTTDPATAGTVCTYRTPFYIRFQSDSYEFADEIMMPGKGFQLMYMQDAMDC